MVKVQGLGLGKLCEALGVDRPNEVTRVVVDIKAGHKPMLYIERVGDAHKIHAALTDPGIELDVRHTRVLCELPMEYDGERVSKWCGLKIGHAGDCDPAPEVVHIRKSEAFPASSWKLNLCGAEGGKATNFGESNCDPCRAAWVTGDYPS